ncbi:CaiB/BaiF CoA transferase family protein [Pacificoceanicola onchidii]|uniref:CaiB/BaiF CoA transferase family protein n=1 Tax=Pacificoceanicola onchidii TaxID=2562685 RepID=UPI0010A63F3D|nr:CaiB/BaiF CoA-transferase family protein [Pacificoceanicola onchidii]
MLHGIRIIEFEALGPAPFAGMLLAELGAEVIVVHRRSGGENPAKQTENLLDRGKRSIALDLKNADDLKVAKGLIRSADGLTEGLRPGVMERLGLGPEEALCLNPKLVYGRMTGWGQTGPRATQAGHDLNYLALSGALFYAGQQGPPQTPPTMLGDIGAGAMYLAVGMLAGLLNAKATGKGTVVDAAIVDGASHMMALLLSMGAQFSTTARGQSLLDGPHWSRCYTCADGRSLSVQCLEPQFYALFLERLGLSNDPAFAQPYEPSTWAAATTRLEQVFASAPTAHWADLFAGSDACVVPVLTPEEAKSDPHISTRGIWQGDFPAPAPRFDGVAVQPGPVPNRGQDSAAILSDLQDRGFL